MAGSRTEIAQIVQQSNDARQLLLDQDSELESMILTIEDIEWTRPLNAAERARRVKLRNAQTGCRAAQRELAFVTLQALNQSQEVQRLINALSGVNRDVADALKKVDGIVKVTGTIAKVTSAIEQVLGKLAGLLA